MVDTVSGRARHGQTREECGSARRLCQASWWAGMSGCETVEGVATTTLLKLLLAPALILLATMAGRRWGPAVGGWLAGLPMTSGPASFILALEQGPEFAARAALGTLFGLVSLAAFSLAYGAAARRGRWGGCLAASLGAFGVSTLALQGATLPIEIGRAHV